MMTSTLKKELVNAGLPPRLGTVLEQLARDVAVLSKRVEQLQDANTALAVQIAHLLAERSFLETYGED